jgi:mRNA-degrading endonuclease toxin of MazEF toxin-antitoxin module
VTYRRWDVVAVHYPFIETGEAKKRPGLVVSGEALHGVQGLYWIVMITTARAGHRTDDITVSDRRKSGLPADCVIRVSRLTTLSDAQISHRTGTLTRKDRAAVTALLKRYMP